NNYQIAARSVYMNLKDLGELLDPPVGKSGVNHRLRKIGEKADELRESYGVKCN
ncbi:MAG: helix-turn-helix domain-containing protein, partial [Lachnospira sp.]